VADGDEPAALAALLVERGLAEHGREVHLELLAGGYRNHVYRWRRQPTMADAVVKVFVESPANPLFPTLPQHEASALSLLDGTGLAPEPLAYELDPHLGHVLVYAMVRGETWSSGAAAVGRLLRRVHAVDTGSTVFRFRTLVSTPEDVAAQALSIIRLIDDHPLARLLRQLVDRSAAAAPRASGPRCLVHTDPGPGNVIVGADGTRLIDWQCPGLGDPVEDLAGFASPAIQILYEHQPLADDEVADLLHGYDELPAGNDAARSASARFFALAPLYSARTAAYCAYRMSALAHTEPSVSARYADALHAELASLSA
jgi:hypothetical protein